MTQNEDNNEIPLYEFEVRCPICDKSSVQRQLKKDAYTVVKEDFDKRPVTYQWKKPEFKKFIPSIFYIQRCPHCGFCASQEYFEDGAKDLSCSNHNFRKKMMTCLEEDEGLKKTIELLSERNDGESLYFWAIKKFLMAIRFLQAVPLIEEQDSLPLAKYCLNLSYLLRELEVSNIAMMIKQQTDQLKFDLIALWPDVPISGKLAFEKAHYYYDKTYYNSSIPKRKNIEPQLLQMIGRLLCTMGEITDGRTMFLKALKEANFLENDKLSQGIPNLEEFTRETQDLLLESKKMLSKSKAEPL